MITDDPELEPLPAGEPILDDAELRPIEAEVEHLGEPRGPVIDAWRQSQGGDDVSKFLIWIVAPVAAAGFYILTRKRAPSSSNGHGAAPPVVNDPLLGAVPLSVTIDPRSPLGTPSGGPVVDPGADAGTSPAGDIIKAGWTRADLAALTARLIQDEGYTRPELVHAIIAVESAWNPNAVNQADSAPVDQVDEGDSAGLMQLKLRTAQAFVPHVASLSQLLDPVTNVTAGIRFLKELERKWLADYGLEGVIQMYNLGETRFRKGERNRSYLGKVQAKIQSFQLA